MDICSKGTDRTVSDGEANGGRDGGDDGVVGGGGDGGEQSSLDGGGGGLCKGIVAMAAPWAMACGAVGVVNKNIYDRDPVSAQSTASQMAGRVPNKEVAHNCRRGTHNDVMKPYWKPMGGGR